MAYAIARPTKHQKAAEWFNHRRQDDDENREKSKRPESAQLRGDGIVRRRCGSRFERERGNVLWQIRDVAWHKRLYNISRAIVPS
jgi:hypothetical protein